MNNNTRKSSSPTKKRKANDGRATTGGAHDVNTGKTNDGGGFYRRGLDIFQGDVTKHRQGWDHPITKIIEHS